MNERLSVRSWSGHNSTETTTIRVVPDSAISGDFRALYVVLKTRACPLNRVMEERPPERPAKRSSERPVARLVVMEERPLKTPARLVRHRRAQRRQVQAMYALMVRPARLTGQYMA